MPASRVPDRPAAELPPPPGRTIWSYLPETHHPWVGLVFLLPWLVVYECGVVYLSQQGAQGLRGGADEWLRDGLALYGLAHPWLAPLFVVGWLIFASLWRWSDRPKRPLSLSFGMFLESIALAALLWVIARNFPGILAQFGVPLAAVQFQTPREEIVKYIGAGIYEEVLFRLILLNGFVWLLGWFLPRLAAVPVAMLISSYIFAICHQTQTALPAPQLLFLMAAGLYFCWVYWLRGFGIAVGCHAAYDILVGVSVG